jgi:ferritin-like metal-binding protein YciE
MRSFNISGVFMAVRTVADLFLHELSDTYSAEKQMTKSLPKMARAATDEALAQAFKDHLEETRAQVERIDQIVELTGLKLKRIKCAAMEGLVEEGNDLIDEIDKGPVLDVALIGAAQKVEHYEIASYTTLISLATKLGYAEAVPLLHASLAEEEATDTKLGTLGEAMAIDDAIETED